MGRNGPVREDEKLFARLVFCLALPKGEFPLIWLPCLHVISTGKPSWLWNCSLFYLFLILNAVCDVGHGTGYCQLSFKGFRPH